MAAVVAGFLAVNAVGPFLQAWATKLGELAGESTARVLGRIKVKQVTNALSRNGIHVFGTGLLTDKRTEVEVSATPSESAPEPEPLVVLVLPHHPSDAAKLALIDLNPADNAVRGQTLYWCETIGAWLPHQLRNARCTTQACGPATCSLLRLFAVERG